MRIRNTLALLAVAGMLAMTSNAMAQSAENLPISAAVSATSDKGADTGYGAATAGSCGTVIPLGTIANLQIVPGDTTGQSNGFENDGPACGGYGGPGGLDVIYSFDVPTTGAWVVDSGCFNVTGPLATTFDTSLMIRDNTGGCPGDWVACNGDNCASFRSTVFTGGLDGTPSLVAGATYYLIVDGWSSSTYGGFEVQFIDNSCTADADCNDNLFCTGVETCNLADGSCSSSGDPCVFPALCDEDTNTCIAPEPCIKWKGGPGSGYFFPSNPNTLKGDDVNLETTEPRILDYYEIPILARQTPAGASPIGTPYTVDTELWTMGPVGVAAPFCAPLAVIPGSQCVGLPGVVAPGGSPADLMHCEPAADVLLPKSSNDCSTDFVVMYRTTEPGAGFSIAGGEQLIGNPALENPTAFGVNLFWSGLNMVVGESVKAKVTIKLLSVPWDQGLDLILKLNNLGQVREGNILWIDSLANITKLRDEAAKAKDATLKAEELVTKILYLNYADAVKSVDVAKTNLSPRGEIKIDSRTNSLVVRDVADNLVKVEKIVRDLDQRTPQVQIEARIVQATKNFSRGLGVQWGISGMRSQTIPGTGDRALAGQHAEGPITLNLGASGAAFAQASDFLVNLPSAVAGTSTFGLLIGKFLGTSGALDMRLSAGESLGLSKVVSAPKIITLDNKPAKIEQGSQIPFATTSLQGTQTTFVDATLTLNVTPHVIYHANMVRLEIKATKNSPGAPAGAAGIAIDKKEATTEILLRDGETTVLGGIFEETKTDTTTGVPWFNRIPFLGWLFKTETVVLQQTELLIFVTPTILKE